MGYLVCEECGGYYELKEGESIDDFKGCQCGGKFKYVNSLDELNAILDQKSSSNGKELGDKSICPNCGSKNDSKTKFCGMCGKPLKPSINPDKKQSKSEKPFYCPNCGTENIRTAKTCISCGKSLKVIPKDSKLKLLFLDKHSKYGNKRNYILIGASIIGIALIIFLIFWLPANVFTSHYDDGYVSFDYPSTWKIAQQYPNETGLLFKNMASGDAQGGVFVDLYGGNRSSNGAYTLSIAAYNVNRTSTIPVNTTVNQTVGLDNNGNNITAPVNVSIGETQNVTINNLQTILDNYTTNNKQLKKSFKNGYTYYEGSKVLANSSLIHPGLDSHVVDNTIYDTLIVKEGSTYFFIIELDSEQSYNYNYNPEAYNGYQKVVDSFKIGS